MSFKEIGEKLGLDRNKVFYIYNKYSMKKSTNQTENVTKTYQEILRETADSIKEKLRKQYA
jgi:ClpP class serine protease